MPYVGDTITLGGITATVQELSSTDATLWFAGDDRASVLYISSVGTLRARLAFLREDLERAKADHWNAVGQQEFSVVMIETWGILFAGFIAVYACILVGSLTSEKPARRPRPNRSKP